MATNQYSLLRQWHMLRMVPRAPQQVSAKELCERLDAAGFPVAKRTVERDLQELSTVFPIAVDDGARPYGWSWLRDASSFDLPGLTLPEALTLTLVEQHLRHHLPPSAVDALGPHFQSAARALSAVDGTAAPRAWLDKVRSIEPLQPLLAPLMDEACQRTVYLALMHDRQLKLHYRKRDTDTPTVYPSVHPLAVVQRGGLVYLVCMFAGYEDVRTLALHRVQQAEALYEPARRKPGFDIDDYIASGQFGVIAGEPIALRAVFTRAAGEHLFETPLSADQVLTLDEQGRLQLAATVPHTRALLWWLLGFGDGVVIQEPASLREEIAGIARRMAAAYDKQNPAGAACAGQTQETEEAA
ncbi:WYL domain-containing protein [Massilia sp. Dwa41.01b]|uniref:helix-turn-helix transcriptional regulator n=1 Tax=unclassified Massilia TaxID=2609279 RepID=UPI00160159CC|nr:MULTISPECIES: WYL domain-containing protein [unclassified Massilia]QNA88134.1 WYL domain-containing protein [Massilia sp. Dwa41.01b]QNA99040.1 WYL domain-containing protein [Massilia sp. Se16.2.3]